MLEGRQHFDLDGQQIGLVTAHQILDCGEPPIGRTTTLSVVVIGEPTRPCTALVVDRFLGGRELVVQPLDPRLGKIKDISAGAADGGRLAGPDRRCRGHGPVDREARRRRIA